MTEQQALLVAIITDPGEDTPRLVYADWLQERDQEKRAEFIRLQCKKECDECGGRDLEVGPCGLTDYYRYYRKCRTCSARKERERRLWEEIQPSTFGLTYGFCERGFLHSMTLPGGFFVKHADALYWHPDQQRDCPVTAHPIESVYLTTPAGLEMRSNSGWNMYTGWRRITVRWDRLRLNGRVFRREFIEDNRKTFWETPADIVYRMMYPGLVIKGGYY